MGEGLRETQVSQPRRYRCDRSGKKRLVVIHIDSGIEGYIEQGSRECFGCTEYGEYGARWGPFGCSECGFTGRRRYRGWCPFDLAEWIMNRERAGKDCYLP